MARVVDGKIILGIEDAPLVDVLIDVQARNAARNAEQAKNQRAEALARPGSAPLSSTGK